MIIAVKCKLHPTKEQEKILENSSNEYIKAVNTLTHRSYENEEWKKYTSRHVEAELSGNIRDSIKQDVRSILLKYDKDKRKNPNTKLPVLKKPILKWSYVGYGIKDIGIISIQLYYNGKSNRHLFKADMSLEQFGKLQNNKLGNLRITKKNNKWIAQIAITIQEKDSLKSNVVMGVDVGLKVPAVATISSGKTKFTGNGRMNKFYRRRCKAYKRKLGKAKKQKAICKIKDKERRWMTYQDHCISKNIVDFAVQNNVSQINLEKLTGIRNSTRKSRKNKEYIHKWSFYRLQNFIEYKAKMNGINIVYVNPKNTSQICPACGELNKAEDRLYVCKECGYSTHRDRVGAINIMRVSAIDGNSQSA